MLTLVSVSTFSQNLQPKPIQFDNEDGVFITVDLMDSVSLKLIERTILQKENQTLALVVQNVKFQNTELSAKFDLSLIQITKYRNLWQITERQKDKLFTNLEHQKNIAKNVKKKRLETVFYTSEVVSQLEPYYLLC
jgi:hypothetical protein